MKGRSPIPLADVEDSWVKYLHEPDEQVPQSIKSKFLNARATIPSLRAFDSDSPIFVTWNTISPDATGDANRLSLRGCIGTFQSSPLHTSIPSYAVTSALHDSRFSPIELKELSYLSVSVTLLTDFEECSDPLDWVIGLHGIQVYVRSRRKEWNSCYLPDVAVEQGWDREECVVNCMKKSGWDGTRMTWKSVDEIKVVRFQGSKASMEYEDWKNWRDWMDKQS